MGSRDLPFPLQESLELAPKPPPRTPSTSSDDGGPDGPWSSDDELAKEELDVLERLYLVGREG